MDFWMRDCFYHKVSNHAFYAWFVDNKYDDFEFWDRIGYEFMTKK